MSGLFEEYNPIERVPTNQHGMSSKSITRGSLISFHYPRSFALVPNVIHDPYPMVILTDIWPKYIRGVNLHYLTFPYIKRILTEHGGSNYSYFNVRPDKYIANAFRMYARQGILQPKRLDTDWLIQVLSSVRSFSPGELERIRLNIQQQIQNRLQSRADELTSYEEWRSGLNESQKRQLRGKGLEGQRIITGGVENNLIHPNEGATGRNPANFPPQEGDGGPLSTG